MVEQVPFVVVTDRSAYGPGSDAGSVVNIGIAGGQHGTHVAGIATGNGLFGGAMNGAAPGAEVMAIKVCLTTPSCTASGLIDRVLYAAQNGADLANISIGSLPALNDANNARAVLYDRTIETYDMQLFISSGNSGAGANTVGDPSVATNAVSVGAAITDATWLSNYGSVSDSPFSMMPFSSRGPREDGGIKPNVVAPGAAISTTPLWQPGGPVAGTYALPPGHSMLNGTSMAAPEAAGAAALLVSAYKATFGGQRPKAAALRSAIVSGAQFKSNTGAYEQGAGLIDVEKAWEQLRAGQNPNRIVSSVPVRTVQSSLLATPDTGVGIHDREGVVVGAKYNRIYTLTRTTGPQRAVRHEVTWVGNDGTFSSRGHVMLPLDEPVKLNVEGGAADAGHPFDAPAARRPDHSRRRHDDHEHGLRAARAVGVNGYQVTVSGTVARNDTEHVLVRVPEGAGALKVDMTGAGQSGRASCAFSATPPRDCRRTAPAPSTAITRMRAAGVPAAPPKSRTVVDPQAGVWEVVVEARRTSDVARAPFGVTITALSATIAPNPDVVASAVIGQPLTRQYTVTSRFADFTGRLVGGGALGSTQTQRPTIDHHATQSFDVTLPAGVTSYTVRTGGAGDQQADIDLFVFRCSPACVQVGSSTSATADERVTLNHPVAAQYRIRVEGFNVPAGSTAYDLVDTWVSPALGSLTSDDANALHPAGSSWSPTATLNVMASPGTGRKITGVLQVRTAPEQVIGKGTLVVDAGN